MYASSSSSLQWRCALAGQPVWGLGLLGVLAALFAAMRALGALGPAHLRPLLPLGFVLMALTPWVLLTRTGRAQVGLVWQPHAALLLAAAASGALLAWLIGALGSVWFGAGPQNWYVSVLGSFRGSFDTAGKPAWLLFAAFAVPAMLFSPIGEEIFFRGFLQRGLQDWVSGRAATHLECGFFALVHLCHHGLYWQDGALALWWPSAGVWMVLMYGAARLFAYWRARSGSVLTAVVSHMAFNLAMAVYIFAPL